MILFLSSPPGAYIVLILFYLFMIAMIILILRFVYKWMKKMVLLKQEQNAILAELLKRMK